MKIILFGLLTLALFTPISTVRFQTHKKNQKNKQEAIEEDLKIPIRISSPGGRYISWPDFIKIWKSHHLTIGEIKYLYNLADLDRDTKISQMEWANFHRLFIEPFEKEDTDGNYILNLEELTSSFKTEELKFTQITDEQVSEVLITLDKHPTDGTITFCDYIFIRRANLAFQECAPDHFISISKIDCGLHITVPARRIDLPEARLIEQTKMFLKNGKFKLIENSLDFLSFLYISHIYHYFSNFEMPFVEGYLKKKDILRAVENQQLASQITEEIINIMFEQVEQMDFLQFACSFYIFSIYNRFKVAGDVGLNQEGFMQIVGPDSTDFADSIKQLLNGFIQPTLNTIRVSGQFVGYGGSVTEKDYFINYLQTAATIQHRNKHQHRSKLKTQTKVKVKIHDLTEFYDEETLKLLVDNDEQKHKETFFNILDVSNQKMIRYPLFMKFIKFSWFFINYDLDNNGYLNDQEMKEGVKNYKLPIKLTKEDKETFLDVSTFLTSKQTFQLNFKEFISFFMYKDRFKGLVVPSFRTEVGESDVTMGLQLMGYQINKPTLAQTTQSVDPILGNKLYNYKLAFKGVLSDEITAIKLITSNLTDFVEQVKNYDPEKDLDNK